MNNKDGHAVTFAELPEADARGILLRNSLGRLAYARHSIVEIEPLNYVVDGDWIYGRTSAGSKIATLAHQHWCAFEVDELRSMFDWSSVVVHGTFHVLPPDDVVTSAYQRALTRIRSLYAETMQEGDHAPHRTVIFGIYIDSLSGRSASTSA